MAYYIDEFPGRKITIDGKKHLYFGGTAYLGLQADTNFQNILIRNIRKYGTNYSASRKSNVRFLVYGAAERYLADLVKSEACITMSSGFLSGQLVCNHFHAPAYKLFYAPNTHSALYQSRIKPFVTFSALNIALREHIKSKRKTVPVLFVDSIDFSGCNYPDFERLRSLPLQEVILVADDSHGIGVVGKNGGGTYRKLSALKPKELLVCCSLGKGFGIQAGGVFGREDRIGRLKQSDFFGGASPAASAAISTLLEAEKIYERRRLRLQKNIRIFLDGLQYPKKFSAMKNHPAFSFSDTELTGFLMKERIVVTSFSYPGEDTHLMSRIVLSAAHTNRDITYLTNLINSFFGRKI